MSVGGEGEGGCWLGGYDCGCACSCSGRGTGMSCVVACFAILSYVIPHA